MKRRYPNKSRILLVNITRLGDMLQATPTIAGMKAENPEAHITVLVEKQFEGICKVIPYIDDVIGIDLGMTVRSLAREGDGIVDAYDYVGEVVDDLKKRNFDYVLNMSSSAYTAILLRMLDIKQSGGWNSDEQGFRIIESEWARLFATSVFHNNREYNSLNLVDIFRCSADVEKHPNNLLVTVEPNSIEYAEKLVADFGFTNSGPLLAVQAGASQAKRQWSTLRFVEYIKILTERHNIRVVLTGSGKEQQIVEPIVKGCNSRNVQSAVGKTNLSQLAALLKISDLLVTGDTGPMHMSVAVGTPVVAMFLASAFGFETGPYSEGNLVLQPSIRCGPCNPNKGCARPDCHDHIEPDKLATLTLMRLNSDVKSLPPGLIDPNRLVVYRSFFDQYGFCDLESLNGGEDQHVLAFRKAYRNLWLDDLAGFELYPVQSGAKSTLKIHNSSLDTLARIADKASHGQSLIAELVRLIQDQRASAASLKQVNQALNELDVTIERIGFDQPEAGPITRMFCFSKENIVGTEALDLASQMAGIYKDLERRSNKLSKYYQALS